MMIKFLTPTKEQNTLRTFVIKITKPKKNEMKMLMTMTMNGNEGEEMNLLYFCRNDNFTLC